MSQPRSSESAETQIQHAQSGSIVPDLPISENKLFYPALDGLRAFAVLLVFLEHYVLAYYPVLSWGWAGVDIFFVLSGFLITGILYDTRNAPHRYRNFYARRTLRIFPLYYAVLLSGVLLTPVFHWLWNPAWILWFCYLGNYARFIYLHSPLFPTGALEHLVAQPPYHHLPHLYLGHFWSLCVEEQFYLIWPLIVFSVRDRVRLRNLCIAVCCLTLVARIVCTFVVPQPFLTAGLLYRATPLRADALLLGGLVALCMRGPEADKVRRLGKPALVAFVVGAVLWQVLYRHFSAAHRVYSPDTDAVLTTIGYTLIDLFSAALILAILQPRGLLFHVFTLKWPRRLGQMSYGFYVFHDMLHAVWEALPNHYLRHTRWAGTATTLIALVGTTAVSYLSYRFFETPFLRLKSRFVS